MAKKHGEITENDELHVPKGFTEASNTTALVKNESGVLEYRDLSLLGATGPSGPAGTTLESVAVADILNPSAELSSKGGVAGDSIIIRQVRANDKDLVALYVFDISGESPENLPFSVDGSGGQWILESGTALNNLMIGSASTGLVNGGVIDINVDPTKFDIAAGSGWIIDNYTDPLNPVSKYVTWSASSANLVTNIATSAVSFISIDSTGSIIQRATSFSQSNKRQEILLGLVIHPSNVVISSVVNSPTPSYGAALVADDISQAIGPSINISGNTISANGPNLRIDKSVGSTFNIGSNYSNNKTQPNITTDASQTLASFVKLYRNGSGGYTAVPSITEIDPNFYDNGSGTLAPVPSGKFQIQRIYFSNTDTSLNVLYGHATYNSMAEATAAIYVDNQEVTTSGMSAASLRAFLILKEGATNLETTTDVKFIEAGSLGDTSHSKVNLSTTTLQTSYKNSPEGSAQIITDSTHDAVKVKEGSGVGGSVIEVLKSDDTPLMRLTADGNSVINSHNDLHINGYNSKQLAFNASTGVKNGGTISVGTPNTTFSISDGSGIIVDPTSDPVNPTIVEVNWTGKTNIAVTNIATNLITFVSIDENGDVVQQTSRWSAADSRNKIILGVVVHVDKTIVDTVNNEHHSILDVGGQIGDVLEGIGFVNLDGNIYSANGANLNIDKSSGVMMGHGINFFNDPNNPHKLNLAGLTALTFQYRFSNGDNGATGTTIDPDNIDNKSGGLTALANNKWSIQRIYSFTSNNVKIQRGQASYDSKELAVAGIATEDYTTEPSIAANGMLRGFIIVKKGATDLSNDSQAVFISASKFQTVGGASTGTASTLQSAYDNSGDPEITVTDVSTKAITIKDSATNTNRDNIIEVKNTSDVEVLGVSRNEMKVSMQAYSAMNTLSDAATIATDCNDGNVHTVTLTDNRTLGAPTNLKNGATYIWIIKQDATGSRTLAYNAVFKFPGGDTPILSTAANSVDILTGVSDGTNIYCSLAADFQ
jgi:hypothetical protein